MLRKLLFACVLLCAPVIAHAQSVDARNPVFPGPNGVVIGAPSGGNMGQGTVNATGVYVNGQPVGGSISIPTASLLGGTGTALSGVTLGANLSLNAGVLNAAGGTPGGTTGQVQTNNGSGGFGALPVGQTGNSTIPLTTSGGLLTPSILPIATTSALGVIKPDGTTITVSPSTGLASAVGGAATSVTVGTTTVGGGTAGSFLQNNSGTLGNVAPTGTGSVVLSTSPTLVAPALGTPSAVILTNATGLPVGTGISGLGTGVATALGSAITGSGGLVGATSPTIANPTLSGTIAGAPTASGAWTFSSGLTGTVTGHSTLDLPLAGGTLSGTLTSAGITDSGGINTSATTGFQFAGQNAVREIGTSNSATLIGRLAGASLTSGSYVWTTFGGDSSGASYTTAGEITCYGAGSCQQQIDGQHDTYVGVASGYFDPHGSTNSFFGGDSCRNCSSVTGSSGFGSYVHANFFSGNNFVFGNNAMYGNSGAITFSGTPTANETITITITNDLISGGVTTIVYPVGASPTIANIIAGIAAAWNANTTLINLNIRPYTSSLTPNVLAMTHQGTAAAGDIITLGFSTTGTTVGTVTGGTSASTDGSMIAIGLDAIQGIQATTATRLIGIGEDTLANVTTATDDVAEGYLAGFSCTTCTGVLFLGSNAGYSNTTANSSIYIGSGTGRYENGTANIVVGGASLQGGSATIATGGQSVILGNQAFTSASQTTVQNIESIGNLNGGACTSCNYDIYIGYRVMDTTATSAFDQIVIAPGNTDISTTVGNTNNVFYVFGNSTTPTLYAINTASTPSVFLPGGLLTLGVSGTNAGSIIFENGTSGQITLNVPTGALGSHAITLPDTTDTLAGLNTIQTWTTTQTFSGTLNVTGTLEAAGTAGVTCPTGAPSSSFATVNGVVTHC